MAKPQRVQPSASKKRSAAPTATDDALIVPLETGAGLSPSATVTAAAPARTGSDALAGPEWAETIRRLPARRSTVAQPPSTKRKIIPQETLPSGGNKAQETLPTPEAKSQETLPVSLASDSQPGATLAYSPETGNFPKTAATGSGASATVSAPHPLSGTARPHPARPIERNGDAEPEPDFALLEKIGAGGQGEVWRAWQTSLAREVAVKRLRSGGDVREFLMEAFTTAELDHPNIAPVHDLGCAEAEGEESPIIAMKLARGTPWSDLLGREREAPNFAFEDFLARHLRVLIDVCDAVSYAHAKRVIHRDLKPHQVIVGDFGEVYLLDWGLAVSLDEEALLPRARHGVPRSHTLRTASNQTGTPAYMAPEQTAESPAKLGFHTDVYLLGAILFEIAAGYPPHAGDTASDAYRAARKNILRPLPENCPPELAATIRQALATDPQERHLGVAEFRAEIEGFLSGSGRRAESRKIASEAAQALQESDPAALSYAELSEWRGRLERALQLWPENAEAADLRRLALAAQARKAVDAGDLLFAESLASALDRDDPERAAILERIAAARRQMERERRQRVAALIASVLLLVALAAGGALFALHQKRSKEALAETNAELEVQRDAARRAKTAAEESRDEAVSARAEAVDARGRAEELMEFMLFELRDKLEPLGRLDLLTKVAEGALKYFQSRPLDEKDIEDMRKRAAALSNLSRVILAQGHVERSIEAEQEALKIAQRLSELEPEKTRWRGDIAASLVNIGFALSDLPDRIEEALDCKLRAEKILTDLAAAEPVETRWRHSLVIAKLNIARDYSDAFDDNEKARETLQELLAIGEPLLAEMADDPDLPLQINGARGNMGRVLVDLERIDEAVAIYRDALDEARRRSAEKPDDARWQSAIGRNAVNLGNAILRLRDFEAAAASFREAEAVLAPLVEKDPTHVDRRVSLAEALRKLTLLTGVLGDLPGAVALAERNIALLGDLDAPGATDGVWVNFLLASYTDAAGLSFGHDLAKAEKWVREGLGVAQTIRARGGDAVSVAEHYLASFFLYNGACFEATDGKIEEAFQLLDHAVELGWRNEGGAEKDPDLEPLRQTQPERWADLMRRAAPAEEEPSGERGEGEEESESQAPAEEPSASEEASENSEKPSNE
jgi:hypothetical protein